MLLVHGWNPGVMLTSLWVISREAWASQQNPLCAIKTLERSQRKLSDLVTVLLMDHIKTDFAVIRTHFSIEFEQLVDLRINRLITEHFKWHLRTFGSHLRYIELGLKIFSGWFCVMFLISGQYCLNWSYMVWTWFSSTEVHFSFCCHNWCNWRHFPYFAVFMSFLLAKYDLLFSDVHCSTVACASFFSVQQILLRQ